MSSQQSEGLVLRVTPWSETSAVVVFLTRDFGRITAIAKGARRPKSPFEAALDLLCVCRLVFLAKSGDALDLLTEAKLVRRFRAASRDLLALNCGFYVIEFLLRLTEPDQPLPELYDVATETLEALDRGEAAAELVLRFELQSLRVLGLLPSLDRCAGCGELLSGEAARSFGLLAGGLLCDACLPAQRQVIRLPGDLPSWLQRFSEVPPIGLPLPTLPAHLRRTARRLMSGYLRTVLDQELRLSRWIEDLGR